MFKRLSHAYSLTLAIWFLFRNMKTSTSSLATPLVFFTPANMQNMPPWSQDLLSSQSGPWVLSSGAGVRVLFRVNTTSRHSHPTSNPDNKVTSNPRKLLITSLPQEDCDVQAPPKALFMDHKTSRFYRSHVLKCWAVVLTWEIIVQIWLATNKMPFLFSWH